MPVSIFMNASSAKRFLSRLITTVVCIVLTVQYLVRPYRKVVVVGIQAAVNTNKMEKLPSGLIADIKLRLKTLSGQINGIIKMLDEGKNLKQIDIQFKSVDKGL